MLVNETFFTAAELIGTWPVLERNRQGGSNIVLGNYRFRRHRTNNTTTRWQCTRIGLKCNAYIFTLKNDNTIIKINNIHNHCEPWDNHQFIVFFPLCDTYIASLHLIIHNNNIIIWITLYFKIINQILADMCFVYYFTNYNKNLELIPIL